MGSDWRVYDGLLARCLAASAAFHFGLLIIGNLREARLPTFPAHDMVVDLSLPLGPKASPPPGKLGRVGVPLPSPVPAPVPVDRAPAPSPVPAPVEPAPEPAPIPVADPKPAPAAPEPAVATSAAVLPSAVPASPAGAGSGPGPLGNPSGSAAGDPTASGGGGTGPGARTVKPVPPRLLNQSEVLDNLRRFYPEAERRAGRESRVMVKLLIGVSGAVESVDIVQSGGAAFDKGAKDVAKRMRFSPATLEARPIAVSLPQVIIFRLE
ncbi:MAG: TonB family protein [Elusimicrobia bacterium]|nr:TonB family protein [Elusimicrobiota bacterium]